MRYSIVTPTLLRPTLKRLCDSLDAQTNGDWEHLVAVDKSLKDCSNLDRTVLESVEEPRRRFHFYDEKHPNDYGNSARHKVFPSALGDYIFYIDDDDYLADEKVLETLEQVAADWAIFPVKSQGKRCFHDPPALHKTGSCMFIAKKACNGRFETPEESHKAYGADGHVVEALKKSFKYQSLAKERPLVIYEQPNYGSYEIGKGTRPVGPPRPVDPPKARATKLKYAADGLTVDWYDR